MNANSKYYSARLGEARHNLSRFVEHQAEAIASWEGIRWVPVADAPSTFDDLHRAYCWATTTKSDLPVSSLYSDSTIYTAPEANHAMRFWHDVTHVRLMAEFDVDGELEVAVAHLDVLRAWGFGPETFEHKMMHADTIGQLYFSLVTGTFPADQLRFAEACIELGTADAIERERMVLPAPGLN
jgi:hypothetical protein